MTSLNNNISDIIAENGLNFTKVNLSWNETANKKEMQSLPNWKPIENGNTKAILTGDGIIGIDVDTHNLDEVDEELIKLLNQYQHNTVTKRGYHWIFRTTAKFRSKAAIVPKIDIRGEGGLLYCEYTGGNENISYEVVNTNIPNMDYELENYLLSKMGPKIEINPDEISFSDLHEKPPIQKVQELLKYVSCFDEYDEWLHIGMALKDWDSDIGFDLWNEWSKQSDKYNENEMLNRWNSFKKYGITIGTLIYHAKKNYKVYLHDNDYIIIDKKDVYTGLRKQTVSEHLKQAPLKPKLNILKNIVEKVDFCTPTTIIYNEEEKGLQITINPMEKWKYTDSLDQEIIEDYNKIMNNQLEELVLLICSTIIHSENKLNKILVTACSNKGKTELFKLLNFVFMTASEFYNIIGDNKQWSKSQARKLLQNGLLLADDVATTLPKNVKNLTDTMTVDVKYLGSTEIPLKLLVITSTIEDLLSHANEEIKNRFLYFHIGNNLKVTDSRIRMSNSKKYLEQTKKYLINLILDAFNAPLEESDFRTLQDRYKLDEINERDEIIEEVKKELITEVYPLLVNHNGAYWIKGKTEFNRITKDVVTLNFEDIGGIDITKEIRDLTTQFVSKNRLKIDGENHYKTEFTQKDFKNIESMEDDFS